MEHVTIISRLEIGTLSILNSVMNVFKLTVEDDYDEFDDYDEDFEDDEDD